MGRTTACTQTTRPSLMPPLILLKREIRARVVVAGRGALLFCLIGVNGTLLTSISYLSTRSYGGDLKGVHEP